MTPKFPPPFLLTLLQHCKTLKTLQQIHTQIITTNLHHHPLLISHLLALSSSYSLSYASSIFANLRSPSLFHFNLLLKSHSLHPSPLSLPFCFSHLPRFSRPDSYTFPPLLKICAHQAHFPYGSSLHCCVVRRGLDGDGFVQTALIDFYGKCRRIGDARKVFDEMGVKNVVSWTAMVGGYLRFGDLGTARKVFDEMPVRNLVSWNLMVDGYAKAGDMVSARRLFEEMGERDSQTYATMVDGFAKVGEVEMARRVFDEGRERRDVFVWSAMISGYVNNGFPTEGLKVFLEMYGEGVRPDDHIVVGLISACAKLGNLSLVRSVDDYIVESTIDINKPHILSALIDMNAKCGNLERATNLFDLMKTKDLISYCSLMKGYSIHGVGDKALKLFDQLLKEKIIPDVAAFTVVLHACSHSGLVEEGKHYFELMKSEYSIVPVLEHYSCMVDLLGRAGRLKEAYELIEGMPMEPHAGVLGALLGACRLHGNIELGEAIGHRLFEIEPEHAGNYVLLSNIYAEADRWTKVSQLRETMKAKGLRKLPGCTRV